MPHPELPEYQVIELPLHAPSDQLLVGARLIIDSIYGGDQSYYANERAYLESVGFDEHKVMYGIPEEESGLVGVATVGHHFEGSVTRIYDIAVAPGRRGQGIGRALMLHIATRAKESCDTLVAGTPVSKQVMAQATRLGFPLMPLGLITATNPDVILASSRRSDG